MNSSLDNEDEDLVTEQASSTDDNESPGVNPAVMDYISKLKAAQSTSNENQLYAGLARASGTLAQSIGGRQGQMNTSAYDALDKAAQAPVNQVEAEQNTAAKQNQLEASANELEVTKAENDPDSDQSKAFRNALAQVPGVKAAYGDEFDSLTAADKQNVFDIIKTKEQIDARKQEKALAYASKAGTGQDKAYTDLTKSLENFRGNKAVATAESNKLSADNALGLLNGKDLDNLNPTQIRLFNDELAKIATGGVPGEHGVEALMPNTLSMKLAKMSEFLSGSASKAEVGSFLRQNMEYLKDLRSISAQKVTDYRANLLKGYKNRVKPEDYSEAQATYGLGSGSESAGQAAQSNASIPQVSTPGQMKPKTVTQNGHTYTLNPATGQYE